MLLTVLKINKRLKPKAARKRSKIVSKETGETIQTNHTVDCVYLVFTKDGPPCIATPITKSNIAREASAFYNIWIRFSN